MKIIATALIVALGVPAFAAEPTDKAILGAKTVGVLPVLATGLSRKASNQALTLATAGRAEKPGVVDPNSVVKIDANSGFGFAGQATDADVILLGYGFVLSTLVLEAGDPARLAKSVDVLKKGREVLAPLTPELVAAADRYIAAGMAGRVDLEALAALLGAAQEGLAKGPARGHGYLVAGFWYGLTLVAVSNQSVSTDLVALARPLAELFDADAQFDGADRNVAANLRAMAAIIGAESIDVEAYKAALGKGFDVKADK